MKAKIFGYKELLKTLVEYHITFMERLANEGYEKVFSILLIPYPQGDEENIRELVQPVLRESDRLFYIEGKLIAMLPGTDWNGALNVHDTIINALAIEPVEECIVEYPTDGSNAFELISNLYARYDEIKGE
ncbi:hypothetical protein [Hydrogenimonas urashimensis]|uniref:hypothetical protein n=1 Tax=Hydrogenimonas urashimensis TaxID=2740515 RepID=UPI001915F326|nr:hypothetical protein [Hydrogenimonas urashimensis]